MYRSLVFWGAANHFPTSASPRIQFSVYLPHGPFMKDGLSIVVVSGANFALRALNDVTVPTGQGSAVKAANAATFPATT
jgi:hypothetical protein